MSIYLASASPRRAQLLRQIGVDFEQFAVSIDETPYVGEHAVSHVQRLTEAKSLAAWQYLVGKQLPAALVMTADTIVYSQQQILGKPADNTMAQAMLRQLSGRVHQVLTVVGLRYEQHYRAVLSNTSVYFRTIKEDEITAYCQTSEPLDKAGAYGIQGHAAQFVARIEGSYSGVVGLPLCETVELLSQAKQWLSREQSGTQ